MGVPEEGVGVGVGVDSAALESGGVAYADEEDGGADGATSAVEEAGAGEAEGVSAGADDGDGNTVVYCVTMTTGGTCSDVEGSSSADGDCALDGCIEDSGRPETAAIAELEDKADVASRLASVVIEPREESAGLAEYGVSDAAGVGKTVVYSVLVTTRRVEVTMVELPGDSTAELTGTAEGDAAIDELTRAEPVEPSRLLLGVAGP
jgi:hypothetical protein